MEYVTCIRDSLVESKQTRISGVISDYADAGSVESSAQVPTSNPHQSTPNQLLHWSESI